MIKTIRTEGCFFEDDPGILQLKLTARKAGAIACGVCNQACAVQESADGHGLIIAIADACSIAHACLTSNLTVQTSLWDMRSEIRSYGSSTDKSSSDYPTHVLMSTALAQNAEDYRLVRVDRP